MAKYKCSKCGAEVIVLPEKEPMRSCTCNVSIIAEMTATAHGVGGTKVK